MIVERIMEHYQQFLEEKDMASRPNYIELFDKAKALHIAKFDNDQFDFMKL